VSNPILQDEPDELRELADRILTTVKSGGSVIPSLCWCGEDVYWEIAYTHARAWPDDLAAGMLSYWGNGMRHLSERMIEAANTLEELSAKYGYRHPDEAGWSADELRREAEHVEADAL
jgi:hypothetical protein